MLLYGKSSLTILGHWNPSNLLIFLIYDYKNPTRLMGKLNTVE